MKNTPNVLELTIWLLVGIIAGIGITLSWIDSYKYIKVIIICLITLMFWALTD